MKALGNFFFFRIVFFTVTVSVLGEESVGDHTSIKISVGSVKETPAPSHHQANTYLPKFAGLPFKCERKTSNDFGPVSTENSLLRAQENTRQSTPLDSYLEENISAVDKPVNRKVKVHHRDLVTGANKGTSPILEADAIKNAAGVSRKTLLSSLLRGPNIHPESTAFFNIDGKLINNLRESESA